MDTEIRQIQKQCLLLLDIVDGICRKYDVKYSLCGGSVVGAYLYNACLPWDDDVDLMMTRDNYNKFICLAMKELPKGISIHNYQVGDDFSTPFTKIMNDNTTIVQQDGCISGVFLDITVYDKIPHNWFSKVNTFLWKMSQIVMIGKVESSNLQQRVRNLMLSTVMSSRRCYLKFMEKLVMIFGNSSKEYSYSELFGAFANTTRFKPAIFENYAMIRFEDKEYMIVRDIYEYLHTRYNRTDFREPKEKQYAPHYKYVNFNLPYKEYIKQKTQE